MNSNSLGYIIVGCIFVYMSVINVSTSAQKGPCLNGTCPTGYVCVNDQCYTVSQVCVDKAAPGRVSDCPQRASLCDNKIYYQLMTEQCPKTCNRCNGLITPNTTQPTITNSTCVDKAPPNGVSECPQKSYLCTQPLYVEFMKYQCPRSCGYC